MENKNYQIALFFTKLFELKNMLHNEILPIGVHIGMQTESPKLMESLEIAGNDIEEFLDSNKLMFRGK